MEGKSNAHPYSHIIWDADGSPDSVLALLYLLVKPEICVDIITVSQGLADPGVFSVHLARMLTHLRRRGIPIAAGRPHPLSGTNAFPVPWRMAANGFYGIELTDTGPGPRLEPAPEIMVAALNQATVPMTVFIGGSFTNIAEALRLDPGIRQNIAAIHAVGGCIKRAGVQNASWPLDINATSEWNTWLDPEAACEIFMSGIPIKLTPMTTAQHVTWHSEDADLWDYAEKKEASLAAEVLYWMLGENGGLQKKRLSLENLVAAVNLTSPQLFDQDEMCLQIETEPGDRQGCILVDHGGAPNVLVSRNPNPTAVKHTVSKTLGQHRLISIPM